MEATRKVVVSGIRATGRMHLGNYLGALERCAQMSRDPALRCFFFVADLHTLTTFKHADEIEGQARDIVLDFLAAGVDPERSALYVQSHVPEVTELMWYLSCIAPAGDLQRMPTFKDKVAKHPGDVNAGLLLYPILMAADIIGPGAELVPVGVDQKPHLEFTRELVRKFNRIYGPTLTEPGDIEEEMLMVPGLVAMDAAGHFGKMGKSESPEQTIYLNDPSAVSREKIMQAPTDPARVRRKDPGTPEKCAVYQLHQLVSNAERAGVDNVSMVAEGCRSASIGCRECKGILADNIDAQLAEFHENRAALVAHPERLTEIIRAGDEQARMRIRATTSEVAKRMGVVELGV